MPTPVHKPRVPILVAGIWPKKKPFQRGAQWDGIMPVFGMERDNARSPEALVTGVLTWYHGITDEPGDICMPIDPGGRSDGFVDLCMELGITWFYTFPSRDWLGNVDKRIRGGPPR